MGYMVPMQNKSNKFVIWIVGLVVAALVLTDLLPTFAYAREVVAPLAAIERLDDGRVLVAQTEQRPRKRRTLMDMLFGNDEEEEGADGPPDIPVQNVTFFHCGKSMWRT